MQALFKQRNKINLTRGFTLVELMVALSLFTIVVLAAVSSLYTVNTAARKVEAMRGVLDNLNFALESMSRTIRTGTNVICGGTTNGTGVVDCTFKDNYNNPGTQLSVSGTLGIDADVEYRWWINASGTGEIQKRVKENGAWPDSWVSLTAPEIDIQKFAFYVEGADVPRNGDTVQPNVIMFVQGVATAGENIAPFAVQTYVSIRAAE